MSTTRDVPTGHHIDLQRWIGGRHIRGRQPQLAPHNVAALGDRARLVERNLAVAALPAEAAVARDDQPIRRNELQRFPDLGGNVLGAVGLMINAGWNGAWPSVGLNIVWLAIAIYALRRGAPAKER